MILVIYDLEMDDSCKSGWTMRHVAMNVSHASVQWDPSLIAERDSFTMNDMTMILRQ